MSISPDGNCLPTLLHLPAWRSHGDRCRRSAFDDVPHHLPEAAHFPLFLPQPIRQFSIVHGDSHDVCDVIRYAPYILIEILPGTNALRHAAQALDFPRALIDRVSGGVFERVAGSVRTAMRVPATANGFDSWRHRKEFPRRLWLEQKIELRNIDPPTLGRRRLVGADDANSPP
jgi:hypothetical protein